MLQIPRWILNEDLVYFVPSLPHTLLSVSILKCGLFTCQTFKWTCILVPRSQVKPFYVCSILYFTGNKSSKWEHVLGIGIWPVSIVSKLLIISNTNRKLLEMQRIELLCSVLGTHTIRVPCYCHIFNCLTRLSPHTCTQGNNCNDWKVGRQLQMNSLEWLHNSKTVIMS